MVEIKKDLISTLLYWANALYLRRECLKVVGIPRSLEENVIQVFEKIYCNIDSSNIEACHCITKKNNRGMVKCFPGERIASECYWSKRIFEN